MADEAADHDAAAYMRGQMPIAEQVATYEKVFDKGLVRMGSLAVACVVLFLTVTFCTAAGWFPAAVVTVILAVIGFVFLRRAPTSDQTL